MANQVFLSIRGMKLVTLYNPCLISSDASFAESLYGLRRRAVKIKVEKNNIHLKLNSGDGINHSGLEKRQKVLSVVFLVQCHFPFVLLIFRKYNC